MTCSIISPAVCNLYRVSVEIAMQFVFPVFIVTYFCVAVMLQVSNSSCRLSSESEVSTEHYVDEGDAHLYPRFFGWLFIIGLNRNRLENS